MMRQIGVQPRPAAVAAAIEPGNGVVMIDRRFAVDAQISLAAKFGSRMPHIDADGLAAPGARPPQLRRRERRSADRRLRRGADRERRRQHRFGAGELNLAQRRVVEAGGAPKAGKNCDRFGNGHEQPGR